MPPIGGSVKVPFSDPNGQWVQIFFLFLRYTFLISGSLAVLASLVDSIIVLASDEASLELGFCETGILSEQLVRR